METISNVKKQVKQKYGSAARAVAEAAACRPAAIRACAAATRSPRICTARARRGSFRKVLSGPRWAAAIPPRSSS